MVIGTLPHDVWVVRPLHLVDRRKRVSRQQM